MPKEKREGIPINSPEAKEKLEGLGWKEEKPEEQELPDYSEKDKKLAEKELNRIEKENKISEMIEHIVNNKALFQEVLKEMKERGEENLDKFLREFVEKKIEQQEKTQEGVKKRYH